MYYGSLKSDTGKPAEQNTNQDVEKQHNHSTHAHYGRLCDEDYTESNAKRKGLGSLCVLRVRRPVAER